MWQSAHADSVAAPARQWPNGSALDMTHSGSALAGNASTTLAVQYGRALVNGTALLHGSALTNGSAVNGSQWLDGAAAYRAFSNATPSTADTFTAATTEAGSAPYEDFYNMAQFSTGCIVMPIVCMIGLLCNVLTLIVLNQKSMQTSTNFYLSVLAVADILKLINDTLYFITVLLLRLKPPAGNTVYGYLYPYAHFIFCLATSMSSWLTISVAVERYLMVCHPTRARGLCTLQRAKYVCFSVCSIMTVIALPYAFRYRTITVFDNATNASRFEVETTEMWQNVTFVSIFNWVENLLRSIIPIVILIVLNIQIIRALNKTRANKKMASRNRITIMLVSVIIVFIICLTPDAIMSIVGAGYHDESNLLVKGIREFTDVLLCINAAVNFVLYFGFNSIFRQHFLKIFCKRFVKDDKQQNDESQYRKLPDPSPISQDNATNTPTKDDMKEDHYDDGGSIATGTTRV